jgi:hypothetical protein
MSVCGSFMAKADTPSFNWTQSGPFLADRYYILLLPVARATSRAFDGPATADTALAHRIVEDVRRDKGSLFHYP